MKAPKLFLLETSAPYFYFPPLLLTQVEKLLRNIGWKNSTFEDCKSCGCTIRNKIPNQEVSQMGGGVVYANA